jgi:Flp pilus assembly protein TadB
MDRGMGIWRILLVIYAACILLGATAVTWYILPRNMDMAITLAVWAVAIVWVVWLSVSGRKRED